MKVFTLALLGCALCPGQATNECRPSTLNVPGSQYPYPHANRHDRHNPRRVLVFGKAAVLTFALHGIRRHRFTLRSGSVEIRVAASPQMTFPVLGWRMDKTYHAAFVVA